MQCLNFRNYEELKKISRTLHRLDENMCNGYKDWQGNWNEEAEKRAEKKEITILKRANEIVAKVGLIAYHQSDPRGCSLYLVKEGEENNYTNGENIY